jgi:hypothetical protein
VTSRFKVRCLVLSEPKSSSLHSERVTDVVGNYIGPLLGQPHGITAHRFKVRCLVLSEPKSSSLHSERGCSYPLAAASIKAHGFSSQSPAVSGAARQ